MRFRKSPYLCKEICVWLYETEETRVDDAELGKYCLDMSKLIFGGVILAGIMNLGVENVYLFGVGGILVAFFAAIGFTFYSKSR